MDFIDKLFSDLWAWFAGLFIKLINLIPAPDFVSTVTSGLQTVVENAAYPAYLTGIDVGLPMICSAYLIRFVIRRLPFIG